ncbi:MAG: ABC transporter ATP-binding protein [Leptolyngbyaceae cyanobacterium RM2_2_4]|nr:ABC transporter ATP-binding protein [Leptolyngbyaceae cyanobacterium SM1_4_3]NJO50141.1 ABC transporter ATP-binding protein [Leptolyngbyaceae cyanobacterium RM2_2_4]
MLTIDESRWPFVSAHFQGTDSPEEMARFYARFEEWLARQEQFCLILQRDDAEAAEARGKRSPQVKQMRKDGIAWMKAHKPQTSQYCAGIAMVPDSAKLVAVWGAIVGKMVQNMYGCPGRVFGSTEEAEQWAAEQLGISYQPSKTSAGSSLRQTPSLRRLVVRQRLSLALSGILAALGAALGLVPYYLIYLVSLELLQQSSAELNPQYIWMLALIAVGAVILKGICMGASTHIAHIAAYTILYNTRIELARKLGTLPLGYFSDRTTGEIKKIIHEDVEQLEEGLAHIIPDVVAGLTVPIIAGILLFIVDWRMTLATLGSAVIALSIFGFVMSRFDMSAYNALLAKMNGAVIQYINGMKVIKAFTRTDLSFAQLQDVVAEMRQVYIRMTRTTAFPYATMLTLMRSAAITIIPVGIILYLTGSLSISTFLLFVVLGIGFNRPIMNVLFHGMTAFYQINAAAQRITQVFNEPSLTEPSETKQPQGYAIAFHNISFSYHETQVLNQINFTVPEGSVTALVGASGAGKSTIAKLIPRFWDVSGGEIKIGGVNVKEIPIEQLMDTVSFVFQDVFLFNDTILENIRIGQPSATEAEIIAAAKAARCDEFVETLPQGYHTPIGENGIRLSGGQRQRLSIARAILKNAPIIVLDEATAYVDPENEALVQEALAGLLSRGNKTLVVIAHRLSTITEADQILVIDRGQIIAQGSHPELLETCPQYQKQWQAHTAAQSWQLGRGAATPSLLQSHNGQSKTATTDLTTTEPLENDYSNLKEEDSVWQMIRKLTPRGSEHHLWRAVRWRLAEGVAIGLTSYLVYLVLVALFQTPVNAAQLWRYIAAIILLCFAQTFCGYKANTQAYALTIAVQTKLRLFLADYLRRLPLGFFTQRDTGTIDGLFTTNIMFLEPHHVLETLITAVVTPALIFVVMLVYDWRLALVLASSVPFALLALRFAMNTFARVWRQQSSARVQANARMVDYIQGIPVIRAFNLSGDRLTQFRTGLTHYRNASIRTTTELTPVQVIFLSVLELGFSLLLVTGTALYLNNSLSSDRFLFFMILGLAFYVPMMMLGEMLSFYRIMQNCVRNINEFLRSPLLPEPQSPQQPHDTTIEFNQVSFSYGNETVLNRVSFRIPPRSITALVGYSGSGKTTITNLIARFWDVDQGAVTIGGVDVRQMSTDTLLSQLTMVFQDVYLFNDTIRNNIQFGNPNASEVDLMAAAQAARCHEFVLALPNGYDTVVGEGGSTLSGGEKQRISIARAILKDAPIVLLDEATASIDPENERLIQQALNALSSDKTLIVIAHRLSTVQAADQILVLDQGQVLQQGTHNTLIKQDGLYRQFWRSRQQIKTWKLTINQTLQELG